METSRLPELMFAVDMTIIAGNENNLEHKINIMNE